MTLTAGGAVGIREITREQWALWHLEDTHGSEFKVVPTHGTVEAGFLAGVSMLNTSAWVEL